MIQLQREATPRLENVGKVANGSYGHHDIVRKITVELNKPLFCQPQMNFVQSLSLWGPNHPEHDCLQVHKDYRKDFDIRILEEPRWDFHGRKFIFPHPTQISIIRIIVIQWIRDERSVKRLINHA